MVIYPYIALKGGRCVNLLRGRIDESETYDADPLETAIGFARDGAEWIHVVDLDAVSGEGSNEDLIREMIMKTETPIQVGGGIRTEEQVRRWSDAGAGRIIMATAAVMHPQWVREIAYAYPDQIVVSVDVWQGHVMIRGWQERTAYTPVDFVHWFDGWPLSQIIVTDIDRDLELPESSLALVSKVAMETPTPVIASGLARSLDDIAELKYLYNISGCIVGRALYEGAFTLREAIEEARATPEPIAQFC
jgi:phosphoribosylformimino-5-aminoimidazole carboxamide ribotide isomerase